MAKDIELAARVRDVIGTSAVRRLRREGLLPGVVYGESGQSRPVVLSAHDFGRMLQQHVSERLIVNLTIEGEAPKKVLLKEVQHEPVEGKLLHVDFVEISMTRKLRVAISLVLIGEAQGVTQSGGVLEQQLRTLDVECLPIDLVEKFEVDVTSLQLGSALQVRDLKIDPKFTVLTPPDQPVASVAMPKVEEEVKPEEAAAEAVAGAPAEGAAEGAPGEEAAGEKGAQAKPGEKAGPQKGAEKEAGQKGGAPKAEKGGAPKAEKGAAPKAQKGGAPKPEKGGRK